MSIKDRVLIGGDGMIVYLNDINESLAKEIVRVQIASYNIEAELIGFSDIPQLKDTVESIMISEEVFIGYRLEQEWVGFLSYTIEKDIVDICRLVVHPDHFRKGIAKKLVEETLSLAAGKKVMVSTGTKNHPALNLYKNFGFQLVNKLEVAPGVTLSMLERLGN